MGLPTLIKQPSCQMVILIKIGTCGCVLHGFDGRKNDSDQVIDRARKM
jgi:hypothetical protein